MKEEEFGPLEVPGHSEQDVLERAKAIIQEKAGHVITVRQK
jgi:hypothetical protein